jgi:hypothetical protein
MSVKRERFLRPSEGTRACTARQSGWVDALTWADDTGRRRQRVVASARRS